MMAGRHNQTDNTGDRRRPTTSLPAVQTPAVPTISRRAEMNQNQNKINLGGPATLRGRWIGEYDPTSQEDYRQLIRNAHKHGYASHLRIKDWPIVHDIIAPRIERRNAANRIVLDTLQHRLHRHLRRIVPDDHTSRCHLADGYVTDHCPRERLWIIQADAELETSTKTWYYHAAWLCGRDDGEYFSHRIPARISTVADALAWITPAAVRKARDAGKRVLRQGDIWLVESRFRSDDTRALPWSHRWNPETRDLVHKEHGTLHVPFSFRAYRSKGIGGDVD